MRGGGCAGLTVLWRPRNLQVFSASSVKMATSEATQKHYNLITWVIQYLHIMLQKLCPLLTEGERQWPGVCLRDRGEAEEGGDTAHSRTL